MLQLDKSLRIDIPEVLRPVKTECIQKTAKYRTWVAIERLLDIAIISTCLSEPGAEDANKRLGIKGLA